eukprot:4383086-Alexandrium_andersonii.AAC.1
MPRVAPDHAAGPAGLEVPRKRRRGAPSCAAVPLNQAFRDPQNRATSEDRRNERPRFAPHSTTCAVRPHATTKTRKHC